ncbi:hypothetical protein [Enterobacter cloacae]|uniref:hypothetical protein n=1 Tax=Enterobacter cloacae TaxID=550 RepID=UPI002A825163|nr:hypothetical protein [Enterobacter cloacae]
MTVAVNMQRDAEADCNRPSAMFVYAVQVAVLELRKFRNDAAALAAVLMPKEMVHQLYYTETKRCRTSNDGLRGGCSSCIFYKR